MSRVLIAEDDRRIRQLLVDSLVDSGHEVMEAGDGGIALERSSRERPDLILLDVMMPKMDGFQVLRGLKSNPDTEAIPIIMLTAYPPEKGQAVAAEFGVLDYLSKPWDTRILESAIDVALGRRPGFIDSRAEERSSSDRGDETERQPNFSWPTPCDFIGTAGSLPYLEQKLGGGLAKGSTNLVVGSSLTGKSVLCQHFTYGALQQNQRVAYITSAAGPAKDVLAQMESIGLPASNFCRNGQLIIHNILPADSQHAATPPLEIFSRQLEPISDNCDVVVLDNITPFLQKAQHQEIVDFFTNCRNLCAAGKVIIVAVRSVALRENSLYSRVPAICDTHLWLHGAMNGNSLVLAINILKSGGVISNGDDLIRFQIEPGTGISVIES